MDCHTKINPALNEYNYDNPYIRTKEDLNARRLGREYKNSEYAIYVRRELKRNLYNEKREHRYRTS